MSRASEQKGAYAIATAAAIGFLAVHNMDKVSYQLIRGNKAENPFGTIVGKNSFFRAVGELEKIEFDGETDLRQAVINSAGSGTSDGLNVIISDFFTESDWKKAVDYLCYKKQQVLLVQVLAPEEVDPSYDGRVNLIDTESEDVTDEKNMKLRITRSMQLAYDEALKDYIGDIRSFCASRGADFITVRCDEPIEKAVFGKLLNVGILE